MREWIISLLEPIAETCFEAVKAVGPGAAAIVYVLVLLVLAAWVFTLNQEGADARDRSGRWRIGRDLRTWAVAILVVQAVIYIVLR